MSDEVKSLAIKLAVILLYAIGIFALVHTVTLRDDRINTEIRYKHEIDSLEKCLEWTRDSLMQFKDYRLDRGLKY